MQNGRIVASCGCSSNFLQEGFGDGFTVSKKDGKLVFNDLGSCETRNPSTFWCIEKADEIYKWNDFNEIKIFTTDYESSDDHYTYSKQNTFNKLVPDFNFHSWPQVGIHDYEQFVNEIDVAGSNAFEINRVGWIGNAKLDIRKKMLEIGNSHPELFDIQDMNFIKDDDDRRDDVVLKADKFITTPELVKKYSILIDIEGNGYSGRLKHLLWSHRPVLLVDRPHKEFFFEFLKEWEHYIPVKRDLTDLVEKTQWCMDNYEKSLEIAENAYNFSKTHLTREACYKKWNDIIMTHGG